MASIDITKVFNKLRLFGTSVYNHIKVDSNLMLLVELKKGRQVQQVRKVSLLVSYHDISLFLVSEVVNTFIIIVLVNVQHQGTGVQVNAVL